MTLDKAKKNISYTIEALELEDEYLQARLVHFGFCPGVEVRVKRWAPIFKDPLLVEVDGSQIMISRDHAKFLRITEVSA